MRSLIKLSTVDCAAKLNLRPDLSGYEKVRRIARALGHSKGVAAALAAPLRRELLRIVQVGGGEVPKR